MAFITKSGHRLPEKLEDNPPFKGVLMEKEVIFDLWKEMGFGGFRQCTFPFKFSVMAEAAGASEEEQEEKERNGELKWQKGALWLFYWKRTRDKTGTSKSTLLSASSGSDHHGQERLEHQSKSRQEKQGQLSLSSNSTTSEHVGNSMERAGHRRETSQEARHRADVEDRWKPFRGVRRYPRSTEGYVAQVQRNQWRGADPQKGLQHDRKTIAENFARKTAERDRERREEGLLQESKSVKELIAEARQQDATRTLVEDVRALTVIESPRYSANDDSGTGFTETFEDWRDRRIATFEEAGRLLDEETLNITKGLEEMATRYLTNDIGCTCRLMHYWLQMGGHPVWEFYRRIIKLQGDCSWSLCTLLSSMRVEREIAISEGVDMMRLAATVRTVWYRVLHFLESLSKICENTEALVSFLRYEYAVSVGPSLAQMRGMLPAEILESTWENGAPWIPEEPYSLPGGFELTCCSVHSGRYRILANQLSMLLTSVGDLRGDMSIDMIVYRHSEADRNT